MKTTILRNTLRTGVSASILGLALISAPSFAQEAPEDAVADEAATDEAPAIVVTGSRITNPNLELSSPVTAITSETIGLRQANTVEQFIREIPGVVADVGSNVNNGNAGATTLNLRGIGANRNIVLLNGTRIVPFGLGGVTNVDVIPIALLERTDILTGGAGAAYGADAIAGVVNFITKKDFSGAELSVTQGLTELGDGSEFRADFTVGGNFDDGRGNAVISLGYTNRNQITQGDRPFGAVNIASDDGSEGGSATSIPTGVFFGGLFGQIDPDFNGISSGIASPFNFNPFNLFQTPLEQFRIYGQANYEITDSITAYSEGTFVNSTTATQIAPSGSFFNNVTVPLNNPFLTDGLRNAFCDLGGVGQAECDAAGATPFGPTLANGDPNPDFLTLSPQLGRRFVELGTRDNVSENQLFQIKAGLRGDVTSSIEFDVYGAYGESTITSRQSGNGTLTRLNQALFAVDPNACLDPTGGCVPINLFGPVGSLGGDNLAGLTTFLDIPASSAVATTLGQVVGFISGDFGGFSLPSASQPISFVAGAEYRSYSAFTSSDLLSQTPDEVLGNGAAAPDQGGSYDVSELFGELVVPLVSDITGIQALTLELGGRVSDYSTTGTEFTWKAGGSYTPIDGFTIRGNYQRVTRAPNIGELFAPQLTGLGNNSSDPCQGANAANDAALEAVCASQVAGFTGDFSDTFGTTIPADIAGQVNVTTGGNPFLSAEDADTYTIGFILQPNAIPGLSITADYYNISITDAVSAATEDDVIFGCFGPGAGSDGAPNIPAGAAGSDACNLIGRNPDTGAVTGPAGNTPGFITLTSNLGTIATDGIDLAINYTTDIGFAGLNLSVLGNWTNSSTFQATPTAINRECVGFFSSNCGSLQPEYSFTSRGTLQFDKVDVSLQWRFIDSFILEPLVFDTGEFLGSPGNDGPVAGSPFTDFTSIGAEHYFDLSARFIASEQLEFTLAVLNVLDNDPTVVGSDIGSTAFNSGNTFPSTFDTLGRRFSVSARLRF